MAGMPPVLWHQAEGFLVRDPYGNQWIDLTSGIVLANAGHAHPQIVAAIREAVDRRPLATYAFPSESRLKLLETYLGEQQNPDCQQVIADLRGMIAQLPRESFTLRLRLPEIEEAC